MQVQICLPMWKLAALEGEENQQLGDYIIMDAISSISFKCT